ncbi:hypothetical protein GGI42DRAFT_331720 [Trichoderma sp. SZMC 28013]
MRQPFAHLTLPARALVAATQLPMFRTKGALGKLEVRNLKEKCYGFRTPAWMLLICLKARCSYGVDDQSTRPKS